MGGYIVDIKGFIKSRRRFILYGLAGCINTLVDVLVFKLFAFTGLQAEYRQAIGYCAGILCSYLLNSHFAFKDSKNSSAHSQLFRFVFANIVALLVGTLGIKALVSMNYSENISKAIITVIVALVNYFVYKILVFKVKD